MNVTNTRLGLWVRSSGFSRLTPHKCGTTNTTNILALRPDLTCLLALFACGIAVGQEAPNRLQLAKALAQKSNFADAVALVRDAEQDEQTDPSVYYWRGCWHFRLGQIDQSLADFDRYIKLRPELNARLWERGITCYYAGKYADGAKQFELYQTYYDNDVENSVWRFLCQAHVDGIPKSRAAMLPIRNDPRIPMMSVFDLFRGERKPEQVFRAARAGSPSDAELKGRLFYADLYVGLYYDALGEFDLAWQHINSAVDAYKDGHYMWAVAVAHKQRLQKTRGEEQKSPRAR